MSHLDKCFTEQLKEKLLPLGFKKQSSGIYFLPITKDVSGWIGMSNGTMYGVVMPGPIIGIGHKTINKLNAQLRGRKPKRPVFPTISKNLEFISDDNYESKTIETVYDIPREIEKLVDAIQKYAVLFMQENADLKSMLNLMLNNYGIKDYTINFIPIAFHLLGMNNEALSFIENQKKKYEKKMTPLGIDYLKFADNFLIYIKEGTLPEVTQEDK